MAVLSSMGAAQEPPPAGGAVFMEGHLAQDYAKQGDSIRFWISLENRTNGEIQDLRLMEFFHPGFANVVWCLPTNATCGPSVGAGTGCFDAQMTDSVPASPGSAEERLLCARMRPGETLTIQGNLFADKPQRAHNFYAVVSWSSGDLGAPTGSTRRSSRAVALGEAEAVTRTVYWLRTLPSNPAVSIPILVAVLTALFTWLIKRLEQNAVTWSSTMLVEAHKAAVRYYLPTAAHVGAAVGFLRSYQGAATQARKTGGTVPRRDPRTLQRAYFHMMMFQWWYWQIFLNESAFHFKNRMGERVVQRLYGKHVELLGIQRGRIRCLLERILGKLKKDMTLDGFLLMLQSSRSDVGRGWSLFQKWARRPACDADAEILDGFLQVLMYELNRPNLYWYGHHDPLCLTESLRETIYGFYSGQDQEERLKWRTAVEEYLWRARWITKGSWWSWLQKALYWGTRPYRAIRRIASAYRRKHKFRKSRKSSPSAGFKGEGLGNHRGVVHGRIHR